MTIKNRYPLHFINKIIDRVQGTQWFNKIDLKDAYYRIRIEADDEWKTAFKTRYRYYEFFVIFIGFTNIPTGFQTYINQVLRGLIDDFCIVYLDDILIFSKIEEKHIRHLQKICQRLKEHKLYTKPSKCSFYQKEMKFLGFIISSEKVKMDPKQVQTIVEWKDYLPTNVRKV